MTFPVVEVHLPYFCAPTLLPWSIPVSVQHCLSLCNVVIRLDVLQSQSSHNVLLHDRSGSWEISTAMSILQQRVTFQKSQS